MHFSLELEAQMKVANAKLGCVEFPNNHTCVDDSVQSRCKENAYNRSTHESEWMEGSPSGLAKVVELNKEDNGICFPNSEDRCALSEDGPEQEIVFCGHTNLDRHPYDSATNDQLVGNNAITNVQNGTTLRQCELENTEVTDGNSDSLIHFNGLMEPINTSENGLCYSSEVPAFKPGKSCNLSNGLVAMDGKIRSHDAEHHGNVEGTNFSPSKTTSVSADSGVVCSYHCCSECLYALHSVILKILTREWGLNRSCWTAEEFHDYFASLSMDLLSAVRKVDIAENISNSFNENLTHGSPKRSSHCPELHKCHCRSSGNNIVVPMECSCHSVTGCVTTKANYSPNSQFGLHPKYIFRDGILVRVDSNDDVSSHCKYETLCLCSIIELVAMMKQPFD